MPLFDLLKRSYFLSLISLTGDHFQVLKKNWPWQCALAILPPDMDIDPRYEPLLLLLLIFTFEPYIINKLTQFIRQELEAVRLYQVEVHSQAHGCRAKLLI